MDLAKNASVIAGPAVHLDDAPLQRPDLPQIDVTLRTWTLLARRPRDVDREPAAHAAAGHPRPRGVFTCTWRDHTGRQCSRKAEDTVAEAEAFQRPVDDQLALGDYRPTSTTTFAAYAADWVEPGR